MFEPDKLLLPDTILNAPTFKDSVGTPMICALNPLYGSTELRVTPKHATSQDDANTHKNCCFEIFSYSTKITSTFKNAIYVRLYS